MHLNRIILIFNGRRRTPQMSVDFVESIRQSTPHQQTTNGSSGSYRAEASETYPIQSSTTKPFFPAVCLKSHWDPTAMLRRIVPQGPAQPLPLDFRPWVKVCMDYTTSAPPEMAPMPPKDMVFGPGGEFYPPGRYSAAINNESLLRRLDRPLGTCQEDQFTPNERGDLFHPELLLTKRGTTTSAMVSELAMPRALLQTQGGYTCRSQADAANITKANQLFNNPTKQQRYKEYQLRSHQTPEQSQPARIPLR